MTKTKHTLSCGEKIKDLREQKHLTQSNLANILHLTRASVNAWELGVSIPSTRYVISLAQIFHVSTDYLLGVNSSRTVDVSGLKDDDVLLITNVINHLRKTREEQSI